MPRFRNLSALLPRRGFYPEFGQSSADISSQKGAISETHELPMISRAVIFFWASKNGGRFLYHFPRVDVSRDSQSAKTRKNIDAEETGGGCDTPILLDPKKMAARTRKHRRRRKPRALRLSAQFYSPEKRKWRYVGSGGSQNPKNSKNAKN